MYFVLNVPMDWSGFLGFDPGLGSRSKLHTFSHVFNCVYIGFDTMTVGETILRANGGK